MRCVQTGYMHRKPGELSGNSYLGPTEAISGPLREATRKALEGLSFPGSKPRKTLHPGAPGTGEEATSVPARFRCTPRAGSLTIPPG
jgi:hypothetical protein